MPKKEQEFFRSRNQGLFNILFSTDSVKKLTEPVSVSGFNSPLLLRFKFPKKSLLEGQYFPEAQQLQGRRFEVLNVSDYSNAHGLIFQMWKCTEERRAKTFVVLHVSGLISLIFVIVIEAPFPLKRQSNSCHGRRPFPSVAVNFPRELQLMIIYIPVSSVWKCFTG